MKDNTEANDKFPSSVGLFLSFWFSEVKYFLSNSLNYSAEKWSSDNTLCMVRFPVATFLTAFAHF